MEKKSPPGPKRCTLSLKRGLSQPVLRDIRNSRCTRIPRTTRAGVALRAVCIIRWDIELPFLILDNALTVLGKTCDCQATAHVPRGTIKDSCIRPVRLYSMPEADFSFTRFWHRSRVTSELTLVLCSDHSTFSSRWLVARRLLIRYRVQLEERSGV
jgi:hypothetical protein